MLIPVTLIRPDSFQSGNYSCRNNTSKPDRGRKCIQEWKSLVHKVVSIDVNVFPTRLELALPFLVAKEFK
jgi:hypothetical protein